jgi:hypothetical protein
MRPKSWGVLSILVCMLFALTLTASAAAADELFMVAASVIGDANYLVGKGDGTFSAQQKLQRTYESGIPELIKFSYGNGLGDFDNDGDLDYIMGMGWQSGHIYLFENLGFSADQTVPGYKFDEPLGVADWSTGIFPMDLAVADFNEDGNADFIMSVAGNADTMLYLGSDCAKDIDSNCFTFSPVVLANSQPLFSAGADTADFNNDGHADFVVAPADPEKLSANGEVGPFYVLLGKGAVPSDPGSVLFGDPMTFENYNNQPVWGVAAADFSGDGVADIAAVSKGLLLIYRGIGDGTFIDPDCDGDSKSFCYDEFELNDFSSIDNADVDGDGDQDLIVCNIASNPAGVAVLRNNDGTFAYDSDEFGEVVIYSGETIGELVAVSGPPYESNRDPVAVIEPAYLEVMTGKEVKLDGLLSSDEDGEIVSYWWDFGDATASGATPEHIYYQPGTYAVTLEVTDDKGAVASAQITVKVIPVPVTVKFSPDKLNINSRDKWILATIKAPDDIDAAQIDLDSITVATETSDRIKASRYYRHTFLGKLWSKIQRRMNMVTVQFNRSAVIEAIGGPNDSSVLIVEGKVSCNGGRVDFSGTGTIKTYEKQSRWNWGFLKKYHAKKSLKSAHYCAKRR